jgi:hypothetical protein
MGIYVEVNKDWGGSQIDERSALSAGVAHTNISNNMALSI